MDPGAHLSLEEGSISQTPNAEILASEERVTLYRKRDPAPDLWAAGYSSIHRSLKTQAMMQGHHEQTKVHVYFLLQDVTAGHNTRGWRIAMAGEKDCSGAPESGQAVSGAVPGPFHLSDLPSPRTRFTLTLSPHGRVTGSSR